MQDFFKQPHAPPIALPELVEQLRRNVAEGSELVVFEDRFKVPDLDRWIVGAVADKFSPVEVWLPADVHDRVYATLGQFWKPLWGTGDTERAVPRAQVSWSIIWTLGPLPLRVWSRRGLLISVDETEIRGIVTRGRTYAIGDVTSACVEKSLGELRSACMLRLADGTKLEIISKWSFSRAVAAIVAPLEHRINEALAEVRKR
jgi:hypothetical protein